MTAADARKLMHSDNHWVDFWYDNIMEYIKEAAELNKYSCRLEYGVSESFNMYIMQDLKKRLKSDLFNVSVETYTGSTSWVFDINWIMANEQEDGR